MDLDQTKKSHTEIQVCVRQDPKFTLLSNMAPEEKQEIRHSIFFDISNKKLNFYVF